MRPWNLVLRFLLELFALAGVAVGAYQLAPGILGVVAAVVAPIVGATVWATFNVVEDPSRSGSAPVEVPGGVRLAIELLLFGLGVAGFLSAAMATVGVVFAVALLVHHLASVPRLRWLLSI